jgi:hypothetical protein
MQFDSLGTGIDNTFLNTFYAIKEIKWEEFRISDLRNNIYFGDGAGAGYSYSFLFQCY